MRRGVSPTPIEFTRLSNALSQRLCDNPLEVGEIEWLVDIGESPELQGFTSKRGVHIPGDHDYSGCWIDRTNSFEQFETVRPGKCDIEQNQLGPGEDGELQTFIARQCTEDTVAFLSETVVEDGQNMRVVVDYENPSGRGCQCHHGRPSSSEMPLLPWPEIQQVWHQDSAKRRSSRLTGDSRDVCANLLTGAHLSDRPTTGRYAQRLCAQ